MRLYRNWDTFQQKLLQYMNRCEELRTFRVALNTKHMVKALAKQIEDKNKQRDVERGIEKMWLDVAQKNYALMMAYENEEEAKRKNKMKDINNILQSQIKEKHFHREEEQRAKMEEQANLEKLRLKVIEEEQLAKREKDFRKEEMLKEIKEVNRQSKELHDRRKAQEKVLDDIFCQLIQQELKLQQEKELDTKSQLRKERDLYLASLKEMDMWKKKFEAKAEELRAKEITKLEFEKQKIENEKCEAATKLKKEVLEERNGQIIYLKKQKEESKRVLENEVRLAELFRLENLEAEKEKKSAVKKLSEEYRLELVKQIELNKQILLKQCEDEERELKNSIIKEEAYFNKMKDIMANACSSQVHPFMKMFQGLGV